MTAIHLSTTPSQCFVNDSRKCTIQLSSMNGDRVCSITMWLNLRRTLVVTVESQSSMIRLIRNSMVLFYIFSWSGTFFAVRYWGISEKTGIKIKLGKLYRYCCKLNKVQSWQSFLTWLEITKCCYCSKTTRNMWYMLVFCYYWNGLKFSYSSRESI